MSKIKVPKYRYRVICGASLWGDNLSFQRALIVLLRSMKYHPGEGWEIERFQEVGQSGHRYWRWRAGWKIYPCQPLYARAEDTDYWVNKAERAT